MIFLGGSIPIERSHSNFSVFHSRFLTFSTKPHSFSISWIQTDMSPIVISFAATFPLQMVSWHHFWTKISLTPPMWNHRVCLLFSRNMKTSDQLQTGRQVNPPPYRGGEDAVHMLVKPNSTSTLTELAKWTSSIPPPALNPPTSNKRKSSEQTNSALLYGLHEDQRGVRTCRQPKQAQHGSECLMP